jgi:hypothetical protein
MTSFSIKVVLRAATVRRGNDAFAVMENRRSGHQHVGPHRDREWGVGSRALQDLISRRARSKPAAEGAHASVRGSAASFPTLPPPITVSSSKRAQPPLGSIFLGAGGRGRPEITIKCATGLDRPFLLWFRVCGRARPRQPRIPGTLARCSRRQLRGRARLVADLVRMVDELGGPSPKQPVRLNEAKVDSLLQYQQQQCNGIARVFPVTNKSDRRLYDSI